MSDVVTLTIDDVEVTVPKGTVIVDAAKRENINIPVFCHHPKLEPVGMCRMCLVEVGMPDRNDPEKYNYRMMTGCTVAVAPNMKVRTTTPVVDTAREDIIELLLTSHPLDCPICDKGGECPLQNLTMEHGNGATRFDFSNKMKLDKHVPLGDLIYLDRERCIQCGRCTRFQDEVAGDPVIAFHNRGRRLEIVTLSEPGFDSYWSGNTTDICPVGALTSADFRFGARPWELTTSASICTHCPVGCNTSMSTRREAKSGGREVIKRVMPRQNEAVNEIWICDKGRFVHHYSDHADRLTKPMVRRDGVLVETTWDDALKVVADKFRESAVSVAGLASDRLSNEDLFTFRNLFAEGLKSHNYGLAEQRLAGGDVVAQVGIAKNSNLLSLGKGDAILVVATDLHESAPVWWLRVKQAAERGANLVVLNGYGTRLDKYAKHVVNYEHGKAIDTVRQVVNGAKASDASDNDDQLQQIGQTLINAENLVVFYGDADLNYEQTDVVSKMLGNLLLLKPHAGKINNGLIPVHPRANTQGAWDMGVARADVPDIYGRLGKSIKTLYVAGADPVGDGKMSGKNGLDFLVVQELFMTATAEVADVVLPAQSWAEREGTFTSGERRVQRYYPAIQPVGESRPDWQILAQVGAQIGMGKAKFAGSLIFKQISQGVAEYAGMNYRTLAQVVDQWPEVGGEDLYYGGTSYDNQAGIGEQWASGAESGEVDSFTVPNVDESANGIPLRAALYAPGTLILKSNVLVNRLAQVAELEPVS